MGDMSISEWVRFVEGPRDGETTRITHGPGQAPPMFWPHWVTVDEPLHVYERVARKPTPDGRLAWVYTYVGASSKPAHKFTLHRPPPIEAR